MDRSWQRHGLRRPLEPADGSWQVQRPLQPASKEEERWREAAAELHRQKQIYQQTLKRSAGCTPAAPDTRRRESPASVYELQQALLEARDAHAASLRDSRERELLLEAQLAKQTQLLQESTRSLKQLTETVTELHAARRVERVLFCAELLSEEAAREAAQQEARAQKEAREELENDATASGSGAKAGRSAESASAGSGASAAAGCMVPSASGVAGSLASARTFHPSVRPSVHPRACRHIENLPAEGGLFIESVLEGDAAAATHPAPPPCLGSQQRPRISEPCAAAPRTSQQASVSPR